ncbi:acyltransferase family protein [Legionella spiritensis]|uniref:acyltransferase family protein n=1 Tax=Legionella spiritensis TaxID=452 RepID=UPI000F6C3A7C|nr:heparan-alpha-glucosaminide N-acetyltransferase domain-containing protein [Legionella spiritensis]VEG92136.1 Putative heparan-alpha-glucosaminide N-acetyltransferase [Legionella spiritensis]
MKRTSTRLLSIDVFRGLTVALMILVNSLDDNHGYRWLAHSSWNGCTLADVVFPFFIFIVGVSVALSITALRARGFNTSRLIHKTAKRTAFLFMIGLLLNAYPNHFDPDTIRIFGVLQRIAICYFFSSLLFLTTRIRTQAIIIVALLIVYWLAMTLIPVPGFGAGNLTYEGNFAAYIDGLLIPAKHLYHGGLDPEGIISTFPAIATALLGNLLGAWLLSGQHYKTHLIGMGSAGIAAMITGWVWGMAFPINKILWTSSYVLWTAGLALIVFTFCYWLVEIKRWQKWFKPFEIFGTNAMTAFIIHVIFLKTQALLFLKTSAGDLINLRQFLTEHLFGWTTLQQASFYYGITFTLFWLMVIAFLNYCRFSYQQLRVNNARCHEILKVLQ